MIFKLADFSPKLSPSQLQIFLMLYFQYGAKDLTLPTI